MTTKQRLQEVIKAQLGDFKLVLVSNREPYIHYFRGHEIHYMVPAGGLTQALDPVMQACGGTWVAHGSGNADKKVVDKENSIMVPPQNPQYKLRRVWMTREEEEGYYYGFANQTLWPLCHIVFTQPVFSETHWRYYNRVNKYFAQAVLEEIQGEKALIFVQDYHLALLPQFIRQERPDIIIAHFWHIPWPNPEVFRICPWKEEILKSLLANDLLGFHIRYHCNNFLETVNRELECRIDQERSGVIRKERTTLVQPFPISVDFDQLSTRAEDPEVEKAIMDLYEEYGLESQIIAIGIDRMDYTKGMPNRIKAVAMFLDRYPEYKGRFTFIQAAVPSRIHIKVYQDLEDEVEELVEEVNWRHGWDEWQPIIYLKGHHTHPVLTALYRIAHVCLVTSLHDGMNLVAKEFIACRKDLKGVLILSPFTGAARELETALIINPYCIEALAEAIKEAIEMPLEEQERRMAKLQEIVKNNNIYRWTEDILLSLTRLA
jgi:trehalose 6-phosphate synthase